MVDLAVHDGHLPPGRRFLLLFWMLGQLVCGTLECYQIFLSESHVEVQNVIGTTSWPRNVQFPRHEAKHI